MFSQSDAAAKHFRYYGMFFLLRLLSRRQIGIGLYVRVMAPRKKKEYYPRVNPYTRYNNHKFVQRYQLSKVAVAGLANAFGQSCFCSTRGSRQSGGISIVERVSSFWSHLRRYGLNTVLEKTCRCRILSLWRKIPPPPHFFLYPH